MQMRILSKFLSLSLALIPMKTIAAVPVSQWQTLPVETPLPALSAQGYVTHDGARLWYGSVGEGPPVVLLHGGMASSRSWGNQIPALVAAHRRVLLIDTRGHGRSTLGNKPLSYEIMAEDVLAVLDALKLQRVDIIGWSDGAITGLVIAMTHPDRLKRVYAFGANMDRDSVRTDAFDAPILKLVVSRLAADYAELSTTPAAFGDLHAAVELMQKTEPNYSYAQLSNIRGPKVLIADGDHDEFIKAEHQTYLAHIIPGARLAILKGTSHFAPWQDAAAFNRSVVNFLAMTGRH